jgi:ubiquinone/menaquinone biosynthesis C-methylase UbiE
MTYESFALLYDELMHDVPYDRWIEFVKGQKESYEVKGNKFLDVACGTGEMAIRLSQEGYSVTGVDISSEMLTIAREKAEKSGQSLFLVQQDMTELEGFGEFDMVGIFCDSLNYLETESSVVKTFARVGQHLIQGGLFFFDVHSTYKMNELFMNQTYAYNGEDISYIWQCFEGEDPLSVEHELTFFNLDEQTNQYNRFDELHKQRTFPIEQYEAWLIHAGFEILSITADFTDHSPRTESERIFFTARKK